MEAPKSPEVAKQETADKKVKKEKKQTRASQAVKEDQNLRGGPQVGAKRDPIEVKGQQIAVISIVAPEGTRQKAKRITIKIRGVFNTVEEADAHIEELWKLDPDFDMFKVSMYEWLVVPPPVENSNQIQMRYQQEKLDEIMRGYYSKIKQGKAEVDNRMKAAQKEAKRRLKKKGIKSNMDKEKRTAKGAPAMAHDPSIVQATQTISSSSTESISQAPSENVLPTAESDSRVSESQVKEGKSET